MNHTQQIIQDAIEGGWGSRGYQPMLDSYKTDRALKTFPALLDDAFLDPLFWQAVGKTRGWYVGEVCDEFNRCVRDDEWSKKWHKFIDHLAEGDDYETALNKLV